MIRTSTPTRRAVGAALALCVLSAFGLLSRQVASGPATPAVEVVGHRPHTYLDILAATAPGWGQPSGRRSPEVFARLGAPIKTFRVCQAGKKTDLWLYPLHDGVAEVDFRQGRVFDCRVDRGASLPSPGVH